MNPAGGPMHTRPEPAARQLCTVQPVVPAPPNDPVAFAEAAIGGLLGLVALSPHAKRRLGLSGASRRADGWPAWYLWLAGSNGAYELALLPAADTEPSAGADFTLRYFPHPDEDDFEAFADVERAARISSLFDRTGTPAIESLADIDPSLFHIATLSLVPGRDDDRIGLRLQTQDIWIETTDAGVRRRVPGLALAAPLVDFVVCGRTYHGRQPPASFWLAREAGFSWHIDANGAHPGGSDTTAYTLCVDGLPGLGVPDMLCGGGHTVEPPPADAIVARHHGDDVPERCRPFAPEDWWRAARWTFYPVGAMCGCLGDEATVVGRDDETTTRRRP